jgi:hypothetical protein
MAIGLMALREALVAAGAPEDKANRAAEEIAANENRFDGLDRGLAALETKLTALEGKVNLLTWMIGFNLIMTVTVLWRVFAHAGAL